MRDEPGPGGVRVGQIRSDLDCRVVATSRCVAPTECDSRLPLFGCGSTCRIRLLDSWPPRAEAVVFDSSRGWLDSRVSRLLSPTTTESDSSDIRGGWGGWPDSCPRLVRLCRALSGSVGRRCHGRRNSSDSPSRSKVPPTPRLVDSSDSLSDEDVTGGTTRQTRRRSKVPPTPRLVDSSTQSSEFRVYSSKTTRRLLVLL